MQTKALGNTRGEELLPRHSQSCVYTPFLPLGSVLVTVPTDTQQNSAIISSPSPLSAQTRPPLSGPSALFLHSRIPTPTSGFLLVATCSVATVLQNLSGNTFKYQREEYPQIRIEVVAMAKALTAVRPAYFEPFQRLHGLKVPCSGIGLQLASAHWTVSEEPSGTTLL